MFAKRNETGGIVDDLLVYRIDAKTYMLVVNASNIDKDWSHISKYNTEGVEMINISDKTTLLAVQGPKAAELRQRHTVTLSSGNSTVGCLPVTPQDLIAVAPGLGHSLRPIQPELNFQASIILDASFDRPPLQPTSTIQLTFPNYPQNFCRDCTG